MKDIKSQYDLICGQKITLLLPILFSKSVVTKREMQWIENQEKLYLNGMKVLIDDVIMPSLQLKTSQIYKGFLQSMEEADAPVWRELSKRLGKCVYLLL